MYKSSITQNDVNEYFSYLSDGTLTRKKVITNAYTIKVGDAIGTKDSKGYLVCKFKCKQFKVHRLIFLLHHGYLPKYIDHIDNNPLNNKIDNLREATQSENQFNRGKAITNTTGYKGVSKARNKYKTTITVRGEVIKLGLYDSAYLAGCAYIDAAKKHHKHFYHAKA